MSPLLDGPDEAVSHRVARADRRARPNSRAGGCWSGHGPACRYTPLRSPVANLGRTVAGGHPDATSAHTGDQPTRARQGATEADRRNAIAAPRPSERSGLASGALFERRLQRPSVSPRSWAEPTMGGRSHADGRSPGVVISNSSPASRAPDASPAHGNATAGSSDFPRQPDRSTYPRGGCMASASNRLWARSRTRTRCGSMTDTADRTRSWLSFAERRVGSWSTTLRASRHRRSRPNRRGDARDWLRQRRD